MQVLGGDTEHEADADDEDGDEGGRGGVGAEEVCGVGQVSFCRRVGSLKGRTPGEEDGEGEDETACDLLRVGFG